jgi:pantothenate kinase
VDEDKQPNADSFQPSALSFSEKRSRARRAREDETRVALVGIAGEAALGVSALAQAPNMKCFAHNLTR